MNLFFPSIKFILYLLLKCSFYQLLKHSFRSLLKSELLYSVVVFLFFLFCWINIAPPSHTCSQSQHCARFGVYFCTKAQLSFVKRNNVHKLFVRLDAERMVLLCCVLSKHCVAETFFQSCWKYPGTLGVDLIVFLIQKYGTCRLCYFCVVLLIFLYSGISSASETGPRLAYGSVRTLDSTFTVKCLWERAVNRLQREYQWISHQPLY